MGYCEEIEKLPTGVLLCAKDEQITILNANSEALKILGYSPNDLFEKFDNKLCNIILDEIKSLFNDVAANPEEIFEYDTRLKTPQGSTRWIHNITKYDEHTSIFYIVLSDVTEKVISSQLYLTLEEKMEEQTGINICLEALHSNDEEHVAMNKLLDVILEYYSASSAFILYTPIENSTLKKYEYSESEQNISNELYEMIINRHKDIKETINISLQDCFNTDNELYELLKHDKINKIILSPIINRFDELVAFVGMTNSAKTTSTPALIRMVSKFIADYIEKAKLFEKMQELSYTDSLTKLRNRHSYILKLEEVQKIHPGSLGVSYIDLNGLKIANDTQGHEFGDKLITTLSTMLKKYFGTEVYRVGGDEFIALCENIDREDFETKNQHLKFDMKEDAILDASIGFFWSDDKMDVNSQLEMAENLMYLEKQHYYEVNEITRKGKK